jgi:murein DD-endopeptidase MepM/ murein hydrolase activator NlpD
MRPRPAGRQIAHGIDRALGVVMLVMAVGAGLLWSLIAHHRATARAPRATRTLAGGDVSCDVSALTIARFPLNGVAGRDWMINSYVDRDPSSPGIADYQNRGARARTYDGHQGIDIDIPSFREMDSGAAIIYSVAPGIVDQVIQEQPDRHLICADRWNLVRVRHATGFGIIYGHIRKGSARVVVGQPVAVGTPLAIVGSSGCSTQPHLHLEVRDCANRAVDSLRRAPSRPAGLWTNPPVYDAASDVMDLILRDGPAPTLAQIKDPTPNPARIARDGSLGVGISAAVRGGDVIAATLISPTGAAATQTVGVSGAPRLSHRYASLAFLVGHAIGVWTIEIRINDALKARRVMETEGPPRARLRPAPSATTRAAPGRRFPSAPATRPPCPDGDR